jgi:hypothetical protein
MFWQPRKTIAEKGVESVRIEVSGDPKAGFTLIGAITARGQRLPLFLVAKGLTSKCHQQFGKNFTEVADDSKSGWVNQDVFLLFLLFLCQNRGTGPVALVLNQYPAHITPLSHLRANEFNINLIFVPKGGTAIYQPLDRRTYGALKSKARSKFDPAICNEWNQQPTKESAAKLAHKCWNEIAEENVLNARAIEGTQPEEEREVGAAEEENYESGIISDASACEIEYGHDDVDMADIASVEEDDSDEFDDESE